MTQFFKTQTLEYPQNREEIEVLARALKLLQSHEVSAAIEVLVARHDHLIVDQRPLLKDYDPRTAHV